MVVTGLGTHVASHLYVVSVVLGADYLVWTTVIGVATVMPVSSTVIGFPACGSHDTGASLVGVTAASSSSSWLFPLYATLKQPATTRNRERLV